MQGFVCVGLSLPLLSVVVPEGFASNVSVCTRWREGLRWFLLKQEGVTASDAELRAAE